MKIEEWLALFKSYGNKKLFSTSDLLLLTGEKKDSMAVQLSRLVSSGVIERPVRGWYINPFGTPTKEELAMVIRDPSYISLEYALSRHNVLSQHVYTFTMVTTRPPYSFHAHDELFEYHQVKKALFWGYATDNGIRIAEPEKALLDLIYIRAVKGKELDRRALGSLMDDMYLEELDKGRLISFSKRFDRTTREVVSGLFLV